MTGLFQFFIIKLLDLGPLISLIIGIANPSWTTGLISSTIIAAIGTLLLYTLNGFELAGPVYQIVFGVAACFLAFAFGKGIRALFQRRAR